MTRTDLGPDVAVFRLGARRTTFTLEQITAAVDEHVVGLLRAADRGEFFRSGNVGAVHVLGPDPAEPTLLLVSTDIGWSQRDQDAVDAVAGSATVDDIGRFTVVAGASVTDGPDDGVSVPYLGNRISIVELRPVAGARAEDVVDAVTTTLLPLVGGPPTRAANVLHVSLLADEGADRHWLVFGVDIGESDRNGRLIAELGQVAEITEIGTFVPHSFTLRPSADESLENR